MFYCRKIDLITPQRSLRPKWSITRFPISNRGLILKRKRKKKRHPVNQKSKEQSEQWKGEILFVKSPYYICYFTGIWNSFHSGRKRKKRKTLKLSQNSKENLLMTWLMIQLLAQFLQLKLMKRPFSGRKSISNFLSHHSFSTWTNDFILD